MKTTLLIFALLFGQLGGIAWEFAVAAGQASADAGTGSRETNGMMPPPDPPSEPKGPPFG